MKEPRTPTPAQIRARRRNGKRMSARLKAGAIPKFLDHRLVNLYDWSQAMRKEGR